MSEKDYIAVIYIGGGSTFYRASDKMPAAEKAVKQARRDWKSMYKFPRSREWKVNVWDVTGHEDVWWDEQGMYDGSTNERIDTHETVYVVG